MLKRHALTACGIWCYVINAAFCQVRQQMFRCSNNKHTADANRWLENGCKDPSHAPFYADCFYPWSGVSWHCAGCKCYYFTPSYNVKYDEAKAACEALDSHLAIIRSQEENDRIWHIIESKGLIPNPYAGLYSYWIGWWDEKWIDGSEPLYTNFAFYGKSYECLVMGLGVAPYARWWSRGCHYKHAYICEIQI